MSDTTTLGHQLEQALKHRRANRVDEIVRSEYFDDDMDARDIALGVLEEHPDWTDEQVARHVAQLIEQQ